MPGFVIHIAIAEEYIRKHNDEIKDKRELIRGVLAPDLISKTNKNISKSDTHYGKWGGRDIRIDLHKFLLDSKVDMNNDYWKGYFLHLLTDKEFYLNYFKDETERLWNNNDTYYYDYDCLNKDLMKRYNIDKEYDRNVTECMNFTEGKPKYLKEEKVIKFIDEISNTSIKEYISLIKK